MKITQKLKIVRKKRKKTLAKSLSERKDETIKIFLFKKSPEKKSKVFR